MKILTKQWMRYYRQTILAGQTEAVEGLKFKASSALYYKLYKERLNEFIETEKNNSIYKNRIFDENYIKRVFKARVKNNSDLMKSLPENVISHIDNFDLLGLKYCSQKEMIFLQSFYEKSIRITEEQTIQARKITETSAKFLTQDIDFDMFTEEVISCIKKDKNNLILEFNNYSLTAENAYILEKEQEKINEFDINNPYCGMTVLHTIELYHNENNNSFDLHLLLDNINNLDISSFWYFTINCKNIRIKINHTCI